MSATVRQRRDVAATADGTGLMRASFAAAGATALAAAVAYYPTLLTMVDKWWTSGTFAHGFVMAPLAGWLAWHQRSRLRGATLGPEPAALPALAAIVLCWLIAWSASAKVLEQACMVALVPAASYVLVGRAAVSRMLGPLLLLAFAVPFGEFLMRPLMEFTASATVTLLRLSGIAVYRDGLAFSTSVGDFAVERACSGLRYLIASMALGVFYAMTALRTARNRILFVLVCAVVPIFANAARAYLIVVLAHLSNMRIATGVDHIIYGWVFFGCVMALVYLLGERMRRSEPVEPTPAPAGAILWIGTIARVVATAAIAVCIIISGPVLAARIAAREARTRPIEPTLAHLAGLWQGPVPSDAFSMPAFENSPRIVQGRYAAEGATVDVAVVSPSGVDGGSDVISYTSEHWLATRARSRESWPVTVHSRGGLDLVFISAELPTRLGASPRTIWQTYLFGSRTTTNAYAAKLLSSWNRLVARGTPGRIVILSTGASDGQSVLADFAARNFDALAMQLNCAPAAGAAARLP